MNLFQHKYGPWALVTGASAGIGAEFARQLAARGLNLVLTARRRDRLEELANQLQATHGVETRVVEADLARADFWDDLGPALQDLDLGLLVNNAGFGISGSFLKGDLARELAMLDVNCRAPMILAHRLGPRLLARGRGGMVLVSSVAGYYPAPGAGHYSATKAYDRFLGEILYEELRGRGVDVVTLCPGATRTEFGEVAGFGESGGMRVEPVVRAGLERLGRGAVAVPGALNRLFVLAEGVLPTELRLWVTRLFLRRTD